MEYLLTLWIVWLPSPGDSTILRLAVSDCQSVVDYFLSTLAGDGVTLIAVTCEYLQGV